jgi:tetratricopeptide (TPR) repeat protein
MTAEGEGNVDQELKAVLSGLSPEEVLGRLSLYAERITSFDRGLLLACLGRDAETNRTFDRLSERVNDFIEGVRDGEFCPHEEWDEEWGYVSDDEWHREDRVADTSWEKVLGVLLDDVDRLFCSGHRARAAGAYGRLLNILLEAEQEYLLPEPQESFRARLNEMKVRYLRGVYEGFPLEERAETLLEELLSLTGHDDLYLTLRAVEDAVDEPLPDLEEFLPRWMAALDRNEDVFPPLVLQQLCLEAWLRTATPEEVFSSIRCEAAGNPDFWADAGPALLHARRRDEALAVAEEGLSVVTDAPVRREIGIFLAATARQAGDSELVLTGFREAFRASGEIDLLLLLLDELDDDPELRDGVLEEEAEHASLEAAAAVCALLLGDYVRAARVVSEMDPGVGFAHRFDFQVCMGALLLAAAGGGPDGSCIAGYWRSSILHPERPSLDLHTGEPVLPAPRLTLTERLESHVAAHPLPEDAFLPVLALLRPVVEDLVRAVVRRKESWEYPAASLLATALAEVLALAGRSTAAKRMLNGLLLEFPRHWGFRREMKQAQEASSILQ